MHKMFGINKAVAMAMISLICVSYVYADGLINGSFEMPEPVENNPYGDLAMGWGRWGNWINRETAWSPTHSETCLVGYHHWRIEEDKDSGLFQDINFIPARAEITYSIYVMKDPDTNAEGVELRLEKKGGFEILASKMVTMKDVSTSWEKISVTASNKGEGIRVLLRIIPSKSLPRLGAVKFDDAKLEMRTSAGSPTIDLTMSSSNRP